MFEDIIRHRCLRLIIGSVTTILNLFLCLDNCWIKPVVSSLGILAFSYSQSHCTDSQVKFKQTDDSRESWGNKGILLFSISSSSKTHQLPIPVSIGSPEEQSQPSFEELLRMLLLYYFVLFLDTSICQWIYLQCPQKQLQDKLIWALLALITPD